MNINVFRVLSLLLLARIILTSQFVLILYWIIFLASVEFLQSRTVYKHRSKKFTFLFFLYLLLITVVRTSGHRLSQPITYTINVFEHLLFALVISFIVSLYLGLLARFKNDRGLKRYWYSALLFNCIGFLNEVYQNLAKHKAPFIFSFGARIDLLVNVVGSLLFVLIAYLYLKRRDKQEKKRLMVAQ